MSSEAPKRIWLQWHGDADPELELGDVATGEVSWCENQVYNRDVEYVRTDEVERLGKCPSCGSTEREELVWQVRKSA